MQNKAGLFEKEVGFKNLSPALVEELKNSNRKVAFDTVDTLNANEELFKFVSFKQSAAYERIKKVIKSQESDGACVKLVNENESTSKNRTDQKVRHFRGNSAFEFPGIGYGIRREGQAAVQDSGYVTQIWHNY